jgi:RNA polymerase-binding transcription factor DksA
MNPKQIGGWKSRSRICGENLLRVNHRMPMIAAWRETRRITPADSEREFMIENRERIQMRLRQTECALATLEDGSYGYCEDHW